MLAGSPMCEILPEEADMQKCAADEVFRQEIEKAYIMESGTLRFSDCFEDFSIACHAIGFALNDDLLCRDIFSFVHAI